MIPSRFQVPPRLKGASQSACGGEPPATSMIFSLESAKKPKRPLSGDQKGILAKSAGASCWVAPVVRERTHKAVAPSAPTPTNASRAPSVDMTAALCKNDQLAGGKMDERIRCAAVDVVWRSNAAASAAASKTA